jgi:hypothetical protein
MTIRHEGLEGIHAVPLLRPTTGMKDVKKMKDMKGRARGLRFMSFISFMIFMPTEWQ